MYFNSVWLWAKYTDLTGIKTESFNKKLEVGTMQGHEEKVHNNRSLLEQVGRGRKGMFDGEFSHNGPRFNPFFVPKMIVDIAAGHISIKYGLRGPNYVTVSACASSTNAIIDALMLIQLGKCDL